MDATWEGCGADLRISSLRLKDFRNYEDLRLEGLGGLTVFVGPNAVGKTNIVEGVQMLTALGSFRASKGAEMIRWGSDQAVLECRMVSDSRDLRLVETIKEGVRTYSLNGKRKTAADVSGILPSVMFSPDDLSLVKGAYGLRRAALDALGCQLSRNHRIIRHDYERLVRHKNSLLKSEADPVLLQSVDDLLIPTAVQLYLYRSALFANLASRMAAAFREISGSEDVLEASYVASWEDDAFRAQAAEALIRADYDKQEAAQQMSRALAARALEERARKRCVVGPHADRVELFVNGRNASRFASQGQQRSVALAWRVAELGLCRDMSGLEPVLLLDDVMSELDAVHREGLVDLLGQRTQTFITTTDVSYFGSDIMDRAQIITLPVK